MAQASQQMGTMNQEVTSYVWATNPCLNPTGSKIAYQSSRRTKEGQSVHQIRVMDLITGEESVIVEGALLINWQDKNSVMFQFADAKRNAEKAVYNLQNKQVQWLQ